MVVVMKGGRSPYEQSRLNLTVAPGADAANDNSVRGVVLCPERAAEPAPGPAALDLHDTLAAWVLPTGLGYSVWRLACGIAVMQTACFMSFATLTPFSPMPRNERP
jgi:hypothetical protein